MRVMNDGDVPLRIVADARLLSLEVTPRGARTATHCELPADMRPTDDLTLALIVPPKRSYAESFEPRLYCFSEAKLEALAPGAIVVAKLGWLTGPKDTQPFEASPIESVERELAPVKFIEAQPVSLHDEPTAWTAPPDPARGDADVDADADAPPRLSLRGPTSVDAATPNEIAIPITLRNDGVRSVIVRFRPEVIGFDIIGSGGVEQCVWPAMPAAAMTEMFTTLPPKGSETLELTLSSYCTGHGLDDAGLIVVRPRVDTRNASGAPVGLRSFDGEVIAMVPTIVRLHRGAASKGPLRRPRIEGSAGEARERKREEAAAEEQQP
jgi:hypothetical protein